MAQQDFTVADVLAWARTKPADETYDYSNPNNCALCHFLRDTGRSQKPAVYPYISREPDNPFSGWRHSGESLRAARPYPREIELSLRDGATFGGLVAHLEALCPETPITQSNWAAIDAYLSEIETVSA